MVNVLCDPYSYEWRDTLKQLAMYNSENDVKEKLKIHDFDSISKRNYKKFLTILPKIEPGAAVNIIEQIPKAFNTYHDVISRIMDISRTGEKGFQDACQNVLSSYTQMSRDGSLSESERRELRKEIHEVLKIMQEARKHETAIWKELIHTTGKVAAVAASVAIAVITAGKIKFRA